MSGSAEGRRRDGFTVFVAVCCVVLAALVVLLAWQNFRLKAELADERAGRPARNALQAGDAFGPLVLLDRSGREIPYVFGEDGRRTLLLAFTLDCPACAKTLPLWTGLLAGGAPPDVRVVGLQLDRGREADPTLPWPVLPFDVYGVDHNGSASLGRVPYIPATLLLDGDGVVQRTWYGMLTAEQERELQQALVAG